MKSTKQVIDKYNVSRQTLMSWINSKSITKPQKNWRGWYEWDEINLKEIENLIDNKIKKIKKNTPNDKNEKLNIHNRRYLGSKKRLIPFIDEVIKNNIKEFESVADIFGGTGVVSDYFRKQGKKIIINDILQSNYICYKAWFGNEQVDENKIYKYINFLNNLSPEDNYVSKNFGNKYFSYYNAQKIGVIREEIENIKDINDREKAILLTSLIYAMDKVANTVGHYDAFRKTVDMTQNIYLKPPFINHNRNNEIYCEDANNLVKKINADLVYIDTPYNSRQYGDAYHLLENIVEWKKPSLSGVAMKMDDRSKTKSDYSTNKAPIAFEKLIENIKAKYILVSYNNMAKKGNGRSNAKISNDEIISILEKKGKVKIFETEFQAYTTGKSNIEDHKELLYLCEVKKEYINNFSKEKYIPSAINYTGSKYKLLNQILPLFPDEYDDFIDLFAGGASVALNASPKNRIMINDSIKPLINLYRYLRITDYDCIKTQIDDLIVKYKLSNSSKNGYMFYQADSSKGLANYNKSGYLNMRNDYNVGKYKGKPIENVVLYLLTVFGFNNQIRFNKKGEFNLPVGKRDFNNRMNEKLMSFMTTLKEKEIIFSSDDFKDISPLSDNTFFYADPPYSITTATYTENNGWGIEEDLALFRYLDQCNQNGMKFALSNVSQHKGKINKPLLDWAIKYHIHYLNFNYNNSNYQSKAKKEITHEVLITNY